MKSLIRNQLGDKLVNNYVPMSAANAATLATIFLLGTWKVYSALSTKVDSKTDVSGLDVSVQVSDTTTGKKAYLNFIVGATKNEDDIRAVLIGLTINGVVIDKVAIIKMSPMTFA